MRLQEIAKDVYACLQPDRGLGWSNSGFINRGGGLVVDTFWDLRSTRELIENYSRVWSEPARRVLNTHHLTRRSTRSRSFAGCTNCVLRMASNDRSVTPEAQESQH